ncbi:hypothetical protein [Actinospongicola halichondriae]|uniref:hypothetical protein n=1 Tax=Actinospongicola halichondriae TaxID=3236844 RepID=UPI003D52043D
MTTNAAPPPDETSAEAVLDRLRQMDSARPLLGGFGPLVLAAALLLLMIALAPSVAPERVIERPVGATEVDP